MSGSGGAAHGAGRLFTPAAACSGPDPVVGRLQAAGCVFALEEAAVLHDAAGTVADLERLVRRREAGEPLEQVVGHVDLCGVRLAVGPGVFVPRQRSALLVRLAVEAVQAVDGTAGAAGPRRPVFVEACSGVGPVAGLVARVQPRSEVHAADICPHARRLARRNVPDHAGVHGGHLLEGLPARLRGRVDVVAVVPPYVPDDALRLLAREAREHEPARALLGGPDGLDLVRELVDTVPAWLAPGGRLLVEVSEQQAPAVQAHVRTTGMTAHVRTDEEGTAVVEVCGG